MTIHANGDYQLFVDNVAWQPIDTTVEGDIYVVASGGRFVIYSGGNQIMTFTNEYTPDFQFQTYQRLIFENSQGQTIQPFIDSEGYVQAIGRPNAVTVRAVTFGRYSQEVEDLTVYCNQGDPHVEYTTGYINIIVENYDPEKYLQIMLGNVLLAFVTAI